MKRHNQRGYALVFVFAMFAVMAMLLYLEMPRMAMELQRNREALLIERGEQYVRAIKVFSRTQKKAPQTLDELENTNGRHFLRRRYPDPMTGKDDWRLIHSDTSGRLTDSLVQKQAIPGAPGTTGDSSASATDPNSEQRVAAALNRRASEMPGAPGSVPLPGQTTPVDPNAPPPDPNNPNNAGNPNDPSNPANQQAPNSQFPGGRPPVIMGPNGQPIQPIPGLPGQAGAYPNQPANSQTGGAVPPPPPPNYTFGSGYSGSSGTQTPQQPNAQFQPQQQFQQAPPGGGSQSLGTPTGSPGGANPAAALIQRMLTTPNPNGLRNMQANQTPSLGGGIVGVATKYDAEGIKIYNERTNYKEWEFIYDPSKEKGAKQLPQIPGTVPGQNTGQSNPGFSTGNMALPGQLPAPQMPGRR